MSALKKQSLKLLIIFTAMIYFLAPNHLLGSTSPTINETELKTNAPWINHAKLSEVNQAAKENLKLTLGASDELLSKINVSKIYTSPYYQVDIEGNQYIIDQSAKFWIKAEATSNIFMFDGAVTAINVSNKTREDFLSFISFLEKHHDLTTTYNKSGKQPLYVLMDLNCPHCREFHLTIRESIERKGYRIVYIPVTPDPSKRNLNANYAAFCGDNESKKQKISRIFLNGVRNEVINMEQNCNAIEKAFINYSTRLLGKYNLKGTPLFITETGQFIYGNSALSEWAK